MSDLELQLLRMPTAQFWIYLLLAIGGGVVAFYFAFLYLKRARIIEDTPTSKIRSAAQGYVELQGRAQTMEGAPIIAPLTGSACAWYRYKVERFEDKRTRVVESGCSDELFYLVGKTGQCVIDPEGAHVTPRTKKVWYGNSASDYSPKARHGQWQMVFGKRYKYTEERIVNGDTLYAIGEFNTKGGANEAHNTGEEVRETIRAWKKGPQKLMRLFDRNKDGQIDQHEWEALRKVAHRQVKKQQHERAMQPGIHLLAKPKNSGQPYLLSCIPPRQLTQRFRLIAGAAFTGFLTAGAAAVWMVTVRL